MLNFMVYLQYGAIAFALIVRTIYLFQRRIKYALMSDEDVENDENELHESEKELDDTLWQLNVILPGVKAWVEEAIDWACDHKYIRMIIGYVFCLVPIVNLFLIIVYLQIIFKNNN